MCLEFVFGACSCKANILYAVRCSYVSLSVAVIRPLKENLHHGLNYLNFGPRCTAVESKRMVMTSNGWVSLRRLRAISTTGVFFPNLDVFTLRTTPGSRLGMSRRLESKGRLEISSRIHDVSMYWTRGVVTLSAWVFSLTRMTTTIFYENVPCLAGFYYLQNRVA